MKGGDEFTGCGEIEGKTRQRLRSPDIQKEMVVGAVLRQRLTLGQPDSTVLEEPEWGVYS